MRICSITPHQLVNNPRLVREADALTDAGHDVRVVAVLSLPELRSRDEAIARRRRWRVQFIDIEPTLAGRRAWFVTGARQKLATRVEIRLRAKDQGQIVLTFESNDDFERLLEVLRK